MTYKILEATSDGNIITTKIEMTIDDTTSIVDITHFQPNSIDDIYNSISNRMLTEQITMESAKINAAILTELQIGVVITI